MKGWSGGISNQARSTLQESLTFISWEFPSFYKSLRRVRELPCAAGFQMTQGSRQHHWEVTVSLLGTNVVSTFMKRDSGIEAHE